jgi:hypothetical protein
MGWILVSSGMSRITAYSDMIEIASSVLFMVIGIWATAYAYGMVGPTLFRRLEWRVEFKRQLRWVGPLLVVMSGYSIFAILG